ncbi:MAG: transporter substrate-binding domain-containing protein [Chloroflexota bacterium]|nr:transporter substrate-binding domain-containing protein [Chloroflexota bacterium]
MVNLRRRAPLLLAAGALVLASCTSAANVPAVVCVGESTTYLDWLNGDFQPDSPADITEPSSTAGDLLETVRARDNGNGQLIVSTDPNYAPQSFLQEDGTFVGFDIDVATEIADRLGVGIKFETPDWDAITAGSWSERWDISVGSMTITTPRKEILSFTQPYYYTPAYLAASTRSGVTKVSDLPFTLPTGVEATTLTTDANCAEAIESGRTDFDLWISSGTTIDGAIAAGSPMVKIGEPIFQENLAVAIDKSGPPHAALLFEIDKIIGEMHADGTLKALSEQWFEGADLTTDPSS